MSPTRARRGRPILLVAAALVATLALAACSSTTVGTPVVSTTSSGTTSASPSTDASSPTADSTPTVDPRLGAYYTQQLSWRACDQGIQCARLRVPLSYDNPGAAAISLALVRLRSSRQGDRIGSLVLNPGGPGGSGIDYGRAARSVTSQKLRNRFDIVGFDPRGVGDSSPIRCMTDRQTDAFIAADGSPDNAAEVASQVALSRAFALGCASRSSQLVGRIGTRDAARDVDILRAALGDKQLYWLGKSYGTFLGATYADLFPTHVGRMVLDGAVDPTLTNAALAKGQAAGFELALGRFVDNCLRQSDCPLSGNRATALARIDKFLADVDRKPLPTDQNRKLTQGLAVLAIVGSLYDSGQGWPDLRFGLTEAFRGDGSVLLSEADSYTDRNYDGHYNGNGNDALYAINALDRTDRPGVAQIQQLAREWKTVSPRFGEYLAWGNLPFAYWKVAPTNAPHPITAPGSPPIVVIGTRYDPATPYQWAQALAKQLSNGHFIGWNGDGHTAYLQGSKCVDAAVDSYLLTGAPPVSPLLCR